MLISKANRYNTPPAVAAALARHCPRNARRLLDPCVGTGSLLTAVLSNRRERVNATAIDINGAALKTFGATGICRHHTTRLYKQCFFDWLRTRREFDRKRMGFDCVVMNPPFAGRRERWISTADLRELASPLTPGILPELVPIEVAFVLAGICLLRNNGRLLAVLPSSFVASDTSCWLRKLLLASGNVRQVHELPQFTFPSIESRMYLFVFQRDSRTRRVVLLNHDLQKPERMVFPKGRLINSRFDYRFQQAACRLQRLRLSASLAWRQLGDFADVLRGRTSISSAPKSGVHTGDYKMGFWNSKKIIPVNRPGGVEILQGGDILVKRVSRRCSATFGLYAGIAGQQCTECILIIRSNKIAPEALLFALRCCAHPDLLSPLLERGTGATYISSEILRDIHVPTALSKRFRHKFRQYVNAVRRRDYAEMLRVEAIVRRQLLLQSGQTPLLSSSVFDK